MNEKLYMNQSSERIQTPITKYIHSRTVVVPGYFAHQNILNQHAYQTPAFGVYIEGSEHHRGSEVNLPGSEQWGGWAVSVEKAHRALGSVSPGRTPTSST